MLEMLSAIVNGIGAVVSFFSSFITGIVKLFQLVGGSMAFVVELISYVPPVLVVFITAGFGVVVFFQLIGR